MLSRAKINARISAKINGFLMGLLLAVATATAYSVELAELYEARVLVTDRSEQQRIEALKTALRQVIARITGERALPDGGVAHEVAIEEALEHPDRYVEQFLYETRTSPARGLVFRVGFDPASVDGLLRAVSSPMADRTVDSGRIDPMDAGLGDAGLAEVELVVSGIHTIADYARTLSYLEGMRPDAKVHVTRAMGHRLSFRLWIPGGEAEFARIVEQGTTFIETMGLDWSLDEPLAFRLSQ